MAMDYPTLQQYNEALQYPESALQDAELKKGVLTTTGNGLPLALCGGFALTYIVQAGKKKYAVRCFHKRSNALEQRYRAVSERLKALRSTYFLDFEFQQQGVRVEGKTYPIVKMAWANGCTLGVFLEKNHQNSFSIRQLNASLVNLANYLETQGIAHGDIQPGNVMVANDGKSLQLIDYDGMFVDKLNGLRSAELGHRNFQHPGRVGATWNAQLDRFSFISLNLSLMALQADPTLWAKTNSDGDAVIFSANDFTDPGQSSIFKTLTNMPLLAGSARNFAAICCAPHEQTPSLADYLNQSNIPKVTVSFTGSTKKRAPYISSYPVLDASNYVLCLKHVGDFVELIGRIVEVSKGYDKNNNPFIFLNFGNWRGNIVKISFWWQILETLALHPNDGLKGKWISIVGMLNPPFSKGSYTHLSINATQVGQYRVISEDEAIYRLTKAVVSTLIDKENESNNAGLDSARNIRSVPVQPAITNKSPVKNNKDILKTIRGKQVLRTPLGKVPSTNLPPVTAKHSGSQRIKKYRLLLAIVIIAIIYYLLA
jgi:serine/threonine protein kinase